MDRLSNDTIDLLRSLKRPPTLSRLADSLGINKNRLLRIIDGLRKLGYAFTVDDHQRLTVTGSPDRMIDIEILSGLKTRRFARNLHCYQRIGSTNAAAIDLAEAGAPEGTVVVAEEQTRGRGRLGRQWHSSAGLGIWSSVILRPPIPPDQAGGLSVVAALAFAETVDETLGLAVELKWPNDGLIDGKKVCGILVELSAETDRVHYAVCGTGINIGQSIEDFPPSLRKTASSLTLARGEPIDRLAFYRAFLYRFEAIYYKFRREGLAPLLPGYRDRSILLGRKVSLRQGQTIIKGTATGIDETGALIVRWRGKDIAVRSGEATLR